MAAVSTTLALLPACAQAQLSIYVDASVAKLTNLTSTNYVAGPTIGASAELIHFHGVAVGGDLRASFLGGSRRLDGGAIGPKVSAKIPFLKLKPYGEFLYGFARYNDGLGNASSSTTDAEMQLNAGIDRQVTKHFDWRVFEYSYSQYYALGGQFNPKTFSTGVVYRF